MRDADEAGLLRAIAEDHDNSGRLVLADWLEERGDAARSEFLRVQCELASGQLSADQRQSLRQRERDLLDAHRQSWIDAVGLPVDDVRFERGLIAGLRLTQWDDGKLLDDEFASRLLMLKELDLSGLGIGDEGLRKFAERAQLPALRKLILAGNNLTGEGVPALAAATGMPRLDTVYLFANEFYSSGNLPPFVRLLRSRLKNAAHFHLDHLDVGETKDGYEFSPGQADLARRQYIREHLLPLVATRFRKHERLQSAMLCVAQYWEDEANDAVHATLVVSELLEPTLKGVYRGTGHKEDPPDPNLPNTRIQDGDREIGSSIGLYYNASWDDNGGAIPLWAAFAPEAGTQEYGLVEEVYLPAVLFFRHGGYEILPMARPHLDGIRPEWEE